MDVQTRSGALTAGGLLPKREVIGIGWDVAGTVDALGSGVTGFRGGDAVIGLSDRLALPLKAQAEYVVLDADAVAAVPVGTDPVAEAVGGYAVRLAALAGVRVVAVAGAGDEELVRDLGAKFFVPRTADLPAATDASSGSPGSWVRGLGRDGRGGSGDGHPRAESCRL